MVKCKIHKYPTPMQTNMFGEFTVKLPYGSKILSVDQQRGVIHLWVMFSERFSTFEERYFQTIATGQDFLVAEDVHYLGTVHAPPFVSHVFELLERT